MMQSIARVHWRSEVTHIAGAAMEAAWLSAVLSVLSASFGGHGRALAGIGLFALLYASRAAVRYLADARLELGHSRTLLAYLVAGSLLLVLKIQNYPAMPLVSAGWLRQLVADLTALAGASVAPILTILTVAYAWHRALRVSAEGASLPALMRQFEIGLIAMLVVGFLAERAGVAVSITLWLFWFFFWGLLAIAACRLQDIARSRQASVESYWLPIVLSVTLLVLLGGGIVSLLYSEDALTAVQHALAPLARLLGFLYDAAVTAVLLLVLPLAYLVDFLTRLLLATLGNRNEQQSMEPVAGLDEMFTGMQRQAAGLPPALQEILRWALAVAVLAALVWFLSSRLRRRYAVADDAIEEVRESVWSLAELLAGLRALWQRLLRRLFDAAQPATPRVAAPATAEERTAQTIRQIYRRMLALAAGLGCPRQPSCTPLEFLPGIEGLLPAAAADLRLLTDAYLRARYGLGGSGADDLEAAQQSWQRVRTAAAALRRERAG